MAMSVSRLIRTLQSQFPWLKTVKDDFYFYSRKYLRIPHERDFRALALFPDRPGDLYLDVGANHGQSVASMRLFKPVTRIISFEPARYLGAKLQRLYGRDGNWSLRDVGLGAKAGRFCLYTPVYNGFVYDGLASFDRPSAESWLSEKTLIGFRRDKLILLEETCEVRTLDSLNLAPTLIKIDVQGLEHEVLQGGLKTIARYRPILLIEDYTINPHLAALVEPLGYRPYHFDHGSLAAGAGACHTFLLTDEACKGIGSGEP